MLERSQRGHLLVEVEHVENALLVRYFNVTQVLFVLHIDHVFGECSTELIRFDVHLDFGLFVAPRELCDFLRLNSHLSCLGCCSIRALVCSVALDKHGVAAVNLTV